MVLGLDAGVLTMAAIIATIALVLFVNGILIPEAGNWFLDALVKMPKFQYTFQNGEQGNENFELYKQLRGVAFLIIAIALTYTAVILMGEEFEVYRKGEAFSTLARGLLFIVVIFTFPAIWDLLAGGIEGLAKYVINPNNPNNPQQRVSELMQYIGGIVPPNIDWDDILQFLTDPNSAMQTIFRDVFMAVFKAVLAALLMVLMFLIGTVRIVLTGILAIALPLILALSLVPYFRSVMDSLKNVLVGLLIAPVLSGLTVSAGLALIHSTNFSPLQQWFAAVAIAFLAIFMPTITAPIVGRLTTNITTMATGAVLAGTIMGGQAVMGAVRGGMTALTGLMEAGVPFSPLVYAKSALSGAVRGAGAGVASGAMASIAKALETTGFGRIAEPFHRLERRYERIAPLGGVVSAEAVTGKLTGHVAEGLLYEYAGRATPTQKDYIEARRFADEVSALATKGQYERIADKVNEFYTFKSIPNKIAFGKVFADQVSTFAKDANALAGMYAGLRALKERGGVNALSKDELLETILNRDLHRDALASKYGIEIPNPAFEASSLLQLPKNVEATAPLLLEARNAIAEQVVVSEANPISKRPTAESGALQNKIYTVVTTYLESKGIDTTDPNVQRVVAEFAYTMGRGIAEKYADRPQVIYSLMDNLNPNDLSSKPSEEAIAKGRGIMNAEDILRLYSNEPSIAEALRQLEESVKRV